MQKHPSSASQEYHLFPFLSQKSSTNLRTRLWLRSFHRSADHSFLLLRLRAKLLLLLLRSILLVWILLSQSNLRELRCAQLTILGWPLPSQRSSGFQGFLRHMLYTTHATHRIGFESILRLP